MGISLPVMRHLPRSFSARPGAVRSTFAAVVVALLASGAISAALTAAMDDSIGSGLINFAIFGGLAALTAGVLAWELASSRSCPRCGREGPRGAASCAGCGYDLSARPRFACSEGHMVSFEPGLCDCGRRLLGLRPVPVVRHALTSVWAGLALFVLLLLAAMLVGR
jgi:hypothetical protein